jgi:hypothetical protein
MRLFVIFATDSLSIGPAGPIHSRPFKAALIASRTAVGPSSLLKNWSAAVASDGSSFTPETIMKGTCGCFSFIQARDHKYSGNTQGFFNVLREGLDWAAGTLIG